MPHDVEVTTYDDLRPGFHVFPAISQSHLGAGADEFYWHLVSDNAKRLAVSESYTTVEHAAEGIEAAKRAARKAMVAELRELLFQVGGAATRPLLEDHPDYEFPSGRVSVAIEELLQADYPDLVAPGSTDDTSADVAGDGSGEAGS
jgi:uncharacterized protein YegP (UPF0339 family)